MPLISHSINFEKLITQLLGKMHRQPKRIAWLMALFKPFETVHDKFIEYTDAKWEEIKYNGQTFVLEQMLIARFGEGIYIVNNLGEITGITIGAGEDWVDSIGAGADFVGGIDISFSPVAFDFTVNVPAAVVFVESEMIAWIKKYNSNSFNIVIV